MDVVGKRVENQVQFWSLLGPCLVLLSIAVLLFKVSEHWYFPLSALIGIPLCVKWKMKGMAAALCCLLLLSGIGYQNLELDERYWHVGLALSMAFSFIVMTLSLEEVQGIVHKLQVESQSRLDNFVLLDERWKVAEKEWQAEKESSKAEVNSLSQEIVRTQDEKQTFHKLAELAKDELIQVRGQHDLLLQDLFYKKQQIAQLNERLEETELSLQAFVNSDSEKLVQTLTDRLTLSEKEKEVLKAKMAVIQNEEQTYKQQREQLSQELKTSQEREKACQKSHERLQEEQVDQKAKYRELQNKCSVLEEERNALHKAHVSLRHQSDQIRTTETQHRQSMEQSLHQIEVLKSTLTQYEKDKETLQLKIKELDEQLVQMQKQKENLETKLEAHQKSLQEQLKEQKETGERDLHAAQDKAEKQVKFLEQEIKRLHEDCRKTQEELSQANNQLATDHDKWKEAESKLEHLNQDLCEQQNLLAQANNQIQRLESLKSQLEQVIQETQAQLISSKQQLESTQQKRDQLPYAPGNTRQMEAMYLQLKQQFQDKCSTLDSTRRELFHANEALLKLQKDLDEEKTYGQPTNEKLLQRELLKLGRQYDQMQRIYQQELDELSDLVHHLFHQQTQ